MKKVRSCHIPLGPTTAPNQYRGTHLKMRTPILISHLPVNSFRGGSSSGNLSKYKMCASKSTLQR